MRCAAKALGPTAHAAFRPGARSRRRRQSSIAAGGLRTGRRPPVTEWQYRNAIADIFGGDIQVPAGPIRAAFPAFPPRSC